jgi:Homeodomain-like domain
VSARRSVGVEGSPGHHRRCRRGSQPIRGGPRLRVSQSWISRLVKRYRLEGEGAFQPRSRRPHTSPTRLPQSTIDLIIELREQLASKGLDHGPHTIAWHLAHHHGLGVSVNSIHRHLRAAGYIEAAPYKRPKSSYIRFAAELPNERWQADFTHWWLADQTHAAGGAIEFSTSVIR